MCLWNLYKLRRMSHLLHESNRKERRGGKVSRNNGIIVSGLVGVDCFVEMVQE